MRTPYFLCLAYTEWAKSSQMTNSKYAFRKVCVCMIEMVYGPTNLHHLPFYSMFDVKGKYGIVPVALNDVTGHTWCLLLSMH